MLLNSIKTSVDWTAQMETAILHFWSDLTLVNIEHGTRSQILSGAVQLTNHFSSLFSHGFYMGSA